MKITIRRTDRNTANRIRENWDQVAKPLESLGWFEDAVACIGAASGTADVDIAKRCVVMMCADNGIVKEGVSQSGQDVTYEVASWMGKGVSSVCRMAAVHGTDAIPVDIGINSADTPEGVLPRKVRKGTRNFLREPAMTYDECLQAVNTGIELAGSLKAEGYKIIATGEMGIGNTTTSSAMVSAMLGLPAAEVTGRGAGLDDRGLARKISVIDEAVNKYGLSPSSDPLEVLRCVGGLDIAGLTGLFLGGAVHGIPVVIDGCISAAAALAAEKIALGTKEFMLASHLGKEPCMKLILDELGLEPVIHGRLALGEGTGAVMVFPLLDMALALYRKGLAFSETAVEQYVRYDEHRMTVVIGTPSSGKSERAEQIVLDNSDPDDRIYLATMVPYGEEGKQRVARHRRMREGKGFVTIEKPRDIGEIRGTEGKTVLLECLSNLAANELFETDAACRDMREAEVAAHIAEEVRAVRNKAGRLVVVTNEFEESDDYDDETGIYISVMNRINDLVMDMADDVVDLR